MTGQGDKKAGVLVEIGIDSASDFFRRVAWPNHVAFDLQPSNITALNAAWAYWHLHEWDFWDHQDPTLNRKDARDRLEEHREQVVNDCRELRWLRDITDAWKHRRLHRETVKVRSISPHTVGGIGTRPIATQPIATLMTRIVVDVDGVTHDLKTVLHKASSYWRGRLGID
jgi:hypothetical protein